MRTRMFRFFAIALILTLALSSNLTAMAVDSTYQPSSWATYKTDISEKAGIVPNGFDAMPYTDDITRIEYCQLLVHTYLVYGHTLPKMYPSHPFTDTENIIAEQAYNLGLTNGTEPGIFDPDLPLSREMAATMLSRLRVLFQNADSSHTRVYDYTDTSTNAYIQRRTSDLLEDVYIDANQVSDWAQLSMSDVCSRGIFTGMGNGFLNPKGNITREQSVTLMFNLISYCNESCITKAAGISECVLPAPAGLYISDYYYQSDVILSWNDIPSASGYDVTLFKNGVEVYSLRTSGTTIDLRTGTTTNDHETGVSTFTSYDNPLFKTIFGSDTQGINASIQIVPIDSDGNLSIFSLSRDFSISPWVNANERIYGDPEKSSFASSAEAFSHMTSISVKTWKLLSSGEKTTYTYSIMVNINFAEDIKIIFDDIYNGPEKFPIKNLGGYRWNNGTSEHDRGTAIDINSNENYFVATDGTVLCGSFWTPGVSPYSIVINGDVVQAFNKSGWHWSPDMNWSNGSDYMHFSFMGR